MNDFFSRKIILLAKTKTKKFLEIKEKLSTKIGNAHGFAHSLIVTLRNIFRISNHFLSKVVIIFIVLLVGFSDATAFNNNLVSKHVHETGENSGNNNEANLGEPIALVASASFVPQIQNIGYIPITSGGALIKPEVASQSYSKKKLRDSVVTYTVSKGDTVSTIASKFDLTTKTVAYANGLGAGDSIKQGQALKILPMDGVLYVPNAEESVEALATKFKVSEQEIVEENNLDQETVAPGAEVIIPNAFIPDAPKPTPPAQPQPQQNSNAKQKPKVAGASTTPKIKFGGGGGHKFPYGYCTYWAAGKRGGVPWGGNAKEWAYRASAMGYATGKTPAVGAIYVETWLTKWGHVSYVESVNGNTFTVSEMNYAGFGKVSTRTITGGGGTFIY